MPNLLAQLSKIEQARFLDQLNYMNLEEIHGFCSSHAIPFKVVAEYPDGTIKATKDTDRKPIVLARVRHYLTSGDAGQPTQIPAKIVREAGPPARPKPDDRLYYRWYAREYTGVIRLLRELTDGRFQNGAVVRVLAMQFWTRGEAPTFKQFARAWTRAKADKHRLLTPEYAYLTDLKHQRADGGWKALRQAKAKSALKTLGRIAPAPALAPGRTARSPRR